MPLIAANRYGVAGLGAINPNPPLVSALAAAIRTQEGFYPGSRAYRNNNPGNLMDPGNAIWPQYPKDDVGAVKFPDLATGQAALENDLSIKINRGMTITSLLNMYAPASVGNNTPVYIANVSRTTGIDPNVPLNQVSYDAGGNPTTPEPEPGGPQLEEPAGGFDLTPVFAQPGAYTGPVQVAGMEPPESSPALILGLMVAAGVLFYFYQD